MPEPIYEVVAQAARYWFLLLMALIVWRSYRWLARDRKQRKKRLRLLPDAGYVGELLVVRGGAELPEGLALPVSVEGVLGSVRGDDVYVPLAGVRKRHLWYAFDEDQGLFVKPYGNAQAEVNGQPLQGRRAHAYLTHGSRLTVGDAELRLRMFAGFEHAGVSYAPSHDWGETPAPATAEAQADPQGAVAFTPEQLLAVQQMQQMQQIQWLAAWQAAQGGAFPPAQGAEGYPPMQGMGVFPPVPGVTPANPSGLAGGVPLTPARPSTGAAVAGAPVPAVLSTERGEFLPPPKVSAGGSILPRGGDAAAPDGSTPTQESPARFMRRSRAPVLPPLSDLDAAMAGEQESTGWADDAVLDEPPTHETGTRHTVRSKASPWPDWSDAYPESQEETDGFASGQDFAPSALYAPRVQFYPPVEDEALPEGDESAENLPTTRRGLTGVAGGAYWPDAPDAGATESDNMVNGARYGGELDAIDGDMPYEYADEDEAPRSLYVEPDEAEKAKRLLWDKYLKGGRRT